MLKLTAGSVLQFMSSRCTSPCFVLHLFTDWEPEVPDVVKVMSQFSMFISDICPERERMKHIKLLLALTDNRTSLLVRSTCIHQLQTLPVQVIWRHAAQPHGYSLSYLHTAMLLMCLADL